MGNEEKLNLLQQKLDDLAKKQSDFLEEINNLRQQINSLRGDSVIKEKTEEKVNIRYNARPRSIPALEKAEINPPKPERVSIKEKVQPATKLPKGKSDIEKFIGENLISKIGIGITVIGVAIGAKYAIDNELISPLTRIVLGYLCGAILLGFAIRLKEKYANYSAILLSGAMSIMYFITFAAYSFYSLIPQTLTFVLMVIFTVFTVIAAINYNRQVIALIGMVGAYAVPFLLSDGSGNVGFLFSYMAIINIGILVIAFKKYWKTLHYASFGFTWLIYVGWFFSSYDEKLYFKTALLFLFIFFITFYVVFLSYKLLKKELFQAKDIILVLANSFIFYGFGCAILADNEVTEQYLGLFTLFNAIIHFTVSTIIYKQKLADKNLFNLILGLVLVFITIAIPVQLDGSWVTLLWLAEAALLFWIGRTKQVSFYEALSYPVIVIAFFSLLEDWSNAYIDYDLNTLQPVFNITFLTSLLFLGSLGFIIKLMIDPKYQSPLSRFQKLMPFIKIVLVSIFLLVLYLTFRLEIDNFFNNLYSQSKVELNSGHSNQTEFNRNILDFKTIWDINYTLVFASALVMVSLTKIKNEILTKVSAVILVISILAYMTQGLTTLSSLRYQYINQDFAKYFTAGSFNIIIRYISYVFVSGAIWVLGYFIKKTKISNEYLKMGLNLLFHIFILWILSSELINIMELAHSTQSDKLGLSILWGVYAFLLITLGIWKKKRHLRILAFVLFGVTLIKLFFYDIAELDTISKTIVMVSLGVLLLIISFLYNKYRNIISDESKD